VPVEEPSTASTADIAAQKIRPPFGGPSIVHFTARRSNSRLLASVALLLISLEQARHEKNAAHDYRSYTATQKWRWSSNGISHCGRCSNQKANCPE